MPGGDFFIALSNVSPELRSVDNYVPFVFLDLPSTGGRGLRGGG